MKTAICSRTSSVIGYAILTAMFLIFALVAPIHAESFEDLIDNMKIKFDDIENIAQLSDAGTDISTPGIHLALLTKSRVPGKDSKYLPQIVMRYHSYNIHDGPYVIDRVIVNADGEAYEFKISPGASKLEDTSRGKRVSVTFVPDRPQMEMIRMIASARVVKARFKGVDSGSYDIQLQENQVAALYRMVRFFDAYLNDWKGLDSDAYGESGSLPFTLINGMIEFAEEAIQKKINLTEGPNFEFESEFYGKHIIKTYHVAKDLVFQTLTVDGQTRVIRLRTRHLESIPEWQVLLKNFGEPDSKEGDDWLYSDESGEAFVTITVKDGVFTEALYESYFESNEPQASQEALRYIGED